MLGMNKRLLLGTVLTMLAQHQAVAETDTATESLPQAWWGSVGPVQESTYQRPELPGYEGRYNPWYGVPHPSEEEYLNSLGVEPWHSPGKPQPERPLYPSDNGTTHEGYYDPYRFGYYAPRPRTGFDAMVPPYGAGAGALYPYPPGGVPYTGERPRTWGW